METGHSKSSGHRYSSPDLEGQDLRVGNESISANVVKQKDSGRHCGATESVELLNRRICRYLIRVGCCEISARLLAYR